MKKVFLKEKIKIFYLIDRNFAAFKSQSFFLVSTFHDLNIFVPNFRHDTLIYIICLRDFSVALVPIRILKVE